MYVLRYHAFLRYIYLYNYHKCISYICSYFSKDENESSEAIRNAAKEARENNLDLRASLRKVGAAFLSSREVSAQISHYNFCEH